MDFETWLTTNGRSYDAEALKKPENARQRKDLELAWKAETAPPPEKPKADTEYDVKLAKAKANTERIEAIKAHALAAMEANKGNRAKAARFEELCNAAVEDEKITVEKFKYDMLLEERSTGLIISVPKSPQATDDVVEAAICLSHRLPGVEKTFSDQTLESARKQFKQGLGLKRLLLMGARANGFRGDDSDAFTLARYAMRSRDEFEPRADVGPSTGIQVPGILSNIANKFIAPSFMFTEQAWRLVAKIDSVSDFKTKTTYRMTGANTYRKVAKSGEIKHGAISELSYTDQAETYGILLGVSREDMINDDLGAFTRLASEIGRGAGDVLNNIFWAEWLDDATFFPTDKSKANFDDGATDSVLSLAGLENANTIFNLQTKPDGTPLGADAAILLVPTALDATARQLMSSEHTNVATSSVALTGNANIWRGRFNPVASRYLSRTSLPDGDGVSQTVTGSSTAWYLLADPNNIAAISVVFLFGKDMPTVESADFEFDRLGIATRAYFDFGVNKHEYRAAVKLKGAA